MVKYVGITNDNRYFKVAKKNLHIIPRGWFVYRNLRLNSIYNKKTFRIVEKYEAVRELKTPEDVENFRAINENNLDVLFGYFANAMKDE